MGLGMILTLLTLWVTSVMAYVFIFMLFGLASYLMVTNFIRYFNSKQYLIQLFTSVLLLILQIITVFLLCRRAKRLKMLGTFLNLSAKAIKTHLFLIYSQMIALSILEIFISWIFASLYFQVSIVENAQEKNVINFFTKFILIIFWFWTSGMLIAFADYFITSFTVEWFYNLSKYEEV